MNNFPLILNNNFQSQIMYTCKCSNICIFLFSPTKKHLSEFVLKEHD
eukprot:UN13680